MTSLTTSSRLLGLWMLEDPNWGLAAYVRPQWSDGVAAVISALKDGVPVPGGIVASLKRADALYDVCGSESLAMVRADAGSAIAKYCAEGRIMDAAAAHLRAWTVSGASKADVEAAQAAAKGNAP